MRLFAKTGLLAAFLATVACLVMSVAVFSQGIATGSISGTITDPSGAVLAGAHVRAVNKATNQEFAADTNDAGLIVIRSLPTGTYRITITSNSFRTAVVEGIEVAVARESSLGIVKLELGQVGETVQVEGAAEILESSTSQTTTTFSTKAVAIFRRAAALTH
jgi:hypothetical protein